jgi:hypothetical protein
VHDRAALLYPVIILLSALVLDRRLLFATTGLCILSAAWIACLEQSGALRTPFAGRLGWLPLVDVTIILVVTGVAAHLLVSGVVGGMAEARSKGERLAEANRELEASSAELERFTYRWRSPRTTGSGPSTARDDPRLPHLTWSARGRARLDLLLQPPRGRLGPGIRRRPARGPSGPTGTLLSAGWWGP